MVSKTTATSLTCIAAYAALLFAGLYLTGHPVVQGLIPSQYVPGAVRNVQSWFKSFATEADMPQEVRLRMLLEEDMWKNELILGRVIPKHLLQLIPHFVQGWMRNWLMCWIVFHGIGGLWAYYCYKCFGDKLYPPGHIPDWASMWQQILVSNYAMPLYALVPTIGEWAVEQGYSLAFPRIDNVGWPAYLVYFFLYMTCVEFSVYWVHRGLHDVKWAYKLLHYDHHIYNKEHTLSPFAGLAFNPFDGMLQASPYAYTMLFCPMHMLTHELLLFATGVWTVNIHDCLHGKVWPIMGAGYHAIHHTTYKHNYGHYFCFFDQLYNTLVLPEDYQAALKAGKKIK